MVTPCEPPAGSPEGATAARCACGEVRVKLPGVRLDEWKDHFDYGPDEGGCPSQEPDEDDD